MKAEAMRAILQNQQKVLDLKKAVINRLKPKVLYKITWRYSGIDSKGNTSVWRPDEEATVFVGYPIGFNKESVRMQLLAASKLFREWNYEHCDSDKKKNWVESIKYINVQSIEEVPLEEVPLYVGMKFTGAALEKALS